MKKLVALALATACSASAFPQAKQVPYSSTFYQDADWTVINTTEGTSTWEDNDNSRDFKGTGFSVGKEYGYDRKNPADDWLISPAIHLQAGKEYKVSFWLDAGEMESLSLNWAQQPAVEALSAEGAVLYEFVFIDWGWHRISKTFTPAADGDYYFGFHACSEADKDDIELTGFEVKENVFVPAAPTNLSVTPDINGAVQAVVAWTLPTKDADGADLPSEAVFNRVELYRDGILLQTLPGDAVSFTDTEALGLTAGKHTYEVAVTVNGVTGAKASVESHYIGPLAAFSLPWAAGVGTLTAEDFETYYAIEKGSQSQTSGSRGWALKSGYIQFYPSKYDRQDDWLMMPKVKFEKAGVYRLRATAEFNEAADKPNVEVWKGSGKTIEQMTEKLGAFTSLPKDRADASVAFEISEPGEYHLALHAAADDPQTAKYLKFYEFYVEEAVALPMAVSDLRLELEDNSAHLYWTAPATYNTGKPLEAISKIEIYRNSELLTALAGNLIPGGAMEYVDTPAESGIYTYSLVPYVGELTPDGEPMAVTTGWLGDKLQKLPYSLDFAAGADYAAVNSLWEVRNVNDDYYKWSIGTAAFTLGLDYDGGTADDMLLSPPFELRDDNYDILLRAKGGDSSLPISVGFIFDGSEAIDNPQPLSLKGGSSYTDYTLAVTVGSTAADEFAAFDAQSPRRGRLAIYASGDYDWDLSDVKIEAVSITPQSTDPSVGVDTFVESAGETARIYDLNGLEVKNPQKGSVYILRTGDGKTHKVLF